MNTSELITSNLEFAEQLAKRKKRRADSRIYYDELKSAAYAGLVDAANKFNESVPFKRYAGRRIIGEMEDYIRDLNWNRYSPIQMRRLDDCHAVNDNNNTLHSDATKLMDAVFMILPEEGRDLFNWYYREGFTMKQIGDKLGFTESMVSREIKKYHLFLRENQNELLAIAEF